MTYDEVRQILSRVATPISLYLVPENFEQEKKVFLESAEYNPQFRYRTARKNRGVFDKLRDIEEISDVDPEISNYIIETIRDKEQAGDLLAAIGSDSRFVQISEERFGRVSYALFRRACKILRGKYGDILVADRNERLRRKMLRYDDIVPIFERAFSTFGLEGWELAPSKAIESKGFRTVVKTKRIMVDPKVEISAEKLRKTIIHEVATHAIRSQNGYRTGYELFGKPNIKEYLDDEEGLAMYNEEKYGLLRERDIRRRAALVYAIYLGHRSSFRHVFDALSAVYFPEDAFDVVFRVKRGMSDTSRPGCYYRDACYLRGYLKLRRKLAGNAVGYRYMYAGKIPYSHLFLVEEGILPKPKVVPTKELVEQLFKETGLE